MLITVFGATGQVGKYVIAQALKLGYTVRAFGRNVDGLINQDINSPNLEAIKGYVFNETDVYEAILNSNAVISTLGGSFDGTDKTRSLGIKNIITQMEKAGVNRIIALGGLGILNAEDNTLLIDGVNYPEEYKPVGLEHLAAYQFLAASKLDYTFVCAPNIIDKPLTKQYITSSTYAPTPNNYEIAAGDLAHFMLNELTENHYVHKKVGISRL